MKILAIETSCDDTCAAVLENDRVLSNVISSQTDLHAKWGGVVPDIAKRAHQERINSVVATALIQSKLSKPLSRLKSGSPFDKGEKLKNIINEGIKNIEVIAVTQGPGLAIALSVGVNTAKELAKKYNKKLVAVNHIEGHILSNLLKNSLGKPERKIEFPALALTVSGGHTKIVLVKSTSSSSFDLKEGQSLNLIYEVIGETLDDAAGEALDKAAKMIGLGYPGGPIIERLALKGDKNFLELPHPIPDKKILDYSFSGLKTSFYYKVKDWNKEKIGKNLYNLAATFQEAVFETLIRKYRLAIEKTKPKTLLISGGVAANLEFRKKLRKMAKEENLPIFMPSKKVFNTDNAAMVGLAGYLKALNGDFIKNIDSLDRDPRLNF